MRTSDGGIFRIHYVTTSRRRRRRLKRPLKKGPSTQTSLYVYVYRIPAESKRRRHVPRTEFRKGKGFRG